jgi:hypothetical protein
MSNKFIESVLQSENIIAQIAKEAPLTAELLQYNLEGTIQLLKLSEALFLYKTTNKFATRSSGNNNIKTWKEYKNKIKKYLYSINKQEELGTARDTICRMIYKGHYEKFPLWPPVNETQTSTVDLFCVQSYNFDIWRIVWTSDGEVTVTDRRLRGDVYETEFCGTPDIRLVKLNNSRLSSVEALIKDFDAAKKTVDTLSLRQLTWEELLQ